MKTIALYDFNWHGHHPTYLQIFAESLLKGNFRVVLFCQHPEKIIENLIPNISDDKIKNIQGFPIRYPSGNGKILTAFFQSWHNWRLAAGHLRVFGKKENTNLDFVLFLKIDDYIRGCLPLSFLQQRFPWAWGGLLIHLDLPYQANAQLFRNRLLRLRHYLKARLNNFSVFRVSSCRLVGTLQEDNVNYLQKIVKCPVVHFPEITCEQVAQETPLCQRILTKAKQRKIISLLGLIDRRKGIFTFLEMARRCQSKDWFFLVCGSANNFWTSKQEMDRLNAAIKGYEDDNAFFHLQKISAEAEFNALIMISDVIFAVYEEFPPYSSNLLTKTSLFRKPVLVSAGGLLESRVKRFNLGGVAVAGDADSCITALEKLLNEGLKNPGYADYFVCNSREHFNSFLPKTILAGLER